MRLDVATMVLLVTGLAVGCAGVAIKPGEQQAEKSEAPGLLERPAPKRTEVLAFPPPEGGRRERAPLPKRLTRGRGGLALEHPEPDADGVVWMYEKQLYLYFGQPVRGASAGADASAHVRVEPAVAGVARWVNDRSLTFVAKTFLDPEQTYRLELRDLAALSGGPARKWTYKLKTRSGGRVAGKLLSYTPKAGVLRIVAVKPGDGVLVGRRPTLAVIYDQPVAVPVARGLLSLTDGKGRPVGASLGHPTVDSFEGVPVDRRQVVLVSPRRPLRHGEKLRLVARADQGNERVARLTVAQPLVFTRAHCSSWAGEGEQCEQVDGELRSNTQELHLRFNHPLAPGSVAGHVLVTPHVPGLMVRAEGWDDGHLVLRGAFRPSTRYRVVVAGVKDRYGERLGQPAIVKLHTASLGASVAMAEGVLLVDAKQARSFVVSSRNVREATLELWRVGDDAKAYHQALGRRSSRTVFEGREPDAKLPIRVAVKPDALVQTRLDLRKHVKPGGSYLARLVATKLAGGVRQVRYDKGAAASRPPVALLRRVEQTLAVHAHASVDGAVVHVAELGSGQPVKGAEVWLAADDSRPHARTDDHGVAYAKLAIKDKSDALLAVRAGERLALLPLSQKTATAAELFSDLAGDAPAPSKLRGFVMTDRGIYRPGATVHLKGHVYRAAQAGLAAARARVRLSLTDPKGQRVCAADVDSSNLGGVAHDCPLPAGAKLGLWRVHLAAGDVTVAGSMVRVAEFRPPRFVVDVTASEKDGRVAASVVGRYLFGARMDGATARWTLRREPAPVPSGPHRAAGLEFGDESDRWWDDSEARGPRWSETGEATLDAEGRLALDRALPAGEARGPQRVSLEAEVSDSSHRSVAGRASLLVHSAARYAGLKGPRGWVETGGAVTVSLGVADTEGRSVVGAEVEARLERVGWRRSRVRGPGGGLRVEWRPVRRQLASCKVVSARVPVDCKLPVKQGGAYDVTASVDGRPGGAIGFYAWREGDEAEPAPSKGSAIDIASDKREYRPGDTARLLVQSPYRAATAILTVEAGGLVRHQSERVKGAAAFDLRIERGHAPWVHATVTLLPIGETGEARASYRVGAIRLPVALDGVAIEVSSKSDRSSYRPGERSTIEVEVRRGGKPAAGAEVTLAVVDEAVLRMTSFSAADPIPALYPGLPLDFTVRDTRAVWAEMFERSHVAGDGGGELETAPRTRQKFVETALWRPSLRTDERGLARASFTLPDNLTELRVMAVALDAEGRAGRHESRFVVTQPLLLEPILPRFAAVGDRFEGGAMVHNNTDADFTGVARVAGVELPVEVPRRGHRRVTVPMAPRQAGTLTFVMELLRGKEVLDRLEAPLRVDPPGLRVRPALSGTFAGEQQVALAIPPDIVGPRGDLIVKVGQHLWPELGRRLEYLLDYPHGCVEQTTSSTLPLIAAKDVLPRMGIDKHGEGFFRERITAGLKRLASMRTATGGLAYWPGGREPSVYGTAYAMRAVLAAERAGIMAPEGMRDGMARYLGERLGDVEVDKEVRAAIAASLAELGKLPESAADALWDLADGSVFTEANLALALSRLAGQDKRTSELLGHLEQAYDAGGEPRRHARGGFSSFWSAGRDRAQAALALSALRPRSKLLPGLLGRLARQVEGYTTQATAYSLLALASHLSRLPANGAAPAATLDGRPLGAEATEGGHVFRLPLSELRGKRSSLVLRGDGQAAFGFQLEASYRVPFGSAAHRLAGTSAGNLGVDVHRMFTTPRGAPVELDKIKAGDVLRVALYVDLEQVPYDRRSYLALVDRLPAGFEPVQTDIHTVAAAADVDDSHPLSGLLRWGVRPSHLELHDDRVHIYFDRVGQRELGASYLVRATTPGTFALPPPSAELMYEPDSTSYGEAGEVTIL